VSFEVDDEANRVARCLVCLPNKRRGRQCAGLLFSVLVAALLTPAPIQGQVNGILNKLQQLSQAPPQPTHKANSSLPQQSTQQTAHNVPGGPHISSVSPIYPLRMQKIAIRGTGFGTADPYNGWNGYLMFVNISHGNGITSYWQAGCPVYVCGTGGVSIYVTKWTPTEIDVEGFPQNYGTGTFGMCNCVIQPGDQEEILVANPQMLGAIKQPAPAPYSFPAAAHGAPYDMYTTTVAPWQNPVSITSISTLQAKRLQKIVIRGTGFGNHEPFNGTTPFLGLKDITANNWEAGFDGTVSIIVSSWTPNEIVIDGFSQGYGGDRVLHNGDMVSILVADPQMTGVVSNPGTEFQGAPHATKFVTVSESSSSTTSGNLTVQLQTPVVNGLSVSINGVATPSAPGATITQIGWNWGDGGQAQIGWFPEAHNYLQSGSYTVTVTATDSNGVTGSAQTDVKLATPVPSSTTLWVSQVVPSANDRTAGQVTLNWNIPNGSACKLSVSPAIQNLSGAIPVTCGGSQIGWTASIPNNPKRDPVQYAFQITGKAGSVAASGSLSVYALPRFTYGKSGTAFSSLINTPVWSPKSWGCALELGCWFQFGLSDASGGSTQHSLSVTEPSAKSAGVAVAGIAGYNFAAGGDYDLLAADYGPFPTLPSNYNEHLVASPQQLTLASVQACGAIEGGSGVDYQVVLSDSAGNSHSSTLQDKTCAHLIAGTGGEVVQGAINYLQFLVNEGKLTSDASALAKEVLSQTKVSLSTVTNLLNVVDDLDASPVAGTVMSIKAPVWQPTVPAACAYKFGIAPVVALTTLGAGVGAGELALVQSSISISGIATPASATPPPCQSTTFQLPSSALNNSATQTGSGTQASVTVSVLPTSVAENGQFTVSGTVSNAMGSVEAGATVQISASVNGSTLPLTNVTTTSNGSFSAVLNAPPVAGTMVITATVQGTSPPAVGTATITVTGSQ
jgi:PKD domain